MGWVMRFYVYELVDPRSGTVFYVGKGQGKRVDAHELQARAGKRSKKCNLIREIEAAGLFIEKRKVATFEEESEAYLAEAELVDLYGLENLTNAIPGGYGAYSRALEELRNRPKKDTESSDRVLLSAVCKLLVRVKKHMNAGAKTITALGILEFEIGEMFDSLRDVVESIITRRTDSWVNEHAKRFGIEFVIPAAAV